MKRLLNAFVVLGMLAIGMAGADHPPVHDGYDHGDPPFLLEDGWIPLLNGKNLDGWEKMDPTKPGAWVATRGVLYGGEKNPTLLMPIPTPGDRIVNTVNVPTGNASNIYSRVKMGDEEVYAEFMIPAKSNSGLFIHGLHELQIWDSYGIVPRFDTDRTGSLYHYDDRNLGADGGVVPLVRAEFPHGQWNAYHVWFQAPRFDAAGKKIQNAKFLRVLLNGRLIHENQERLGPTGSHVKVPEAAQNPAVMLQGDHGPVAFRNIYVRPLRPLPK